MLQCLLDHCNIFDLSERQVSLARVAINSGQWTRGPRTEDRESLGHYVALKTQVQLQGTRGNVLVQNYGSGFSRCHCSVCNALHTKGAFFTPDYAVLHYPHSCSTIAICWNRNDTPIFSFANRRSLEQKRREGIVKSCPA